MAAATVIHFGFDDCHRVEVLRRAGYAVEIPSSLDGLRLVLQNGQVDAVILSEEDDDASSRAADLVRTSSPAPVILFRRTQRHLNDRKFDRVYPWLADPNVWLKETAALIDDSRALREHSTQLRADCARVRRETERQRARSRRERERNPGTAGDIWKLE